MGNITIHECEIPHCSFGSDWFPCAPDNCRQQTPWGPSTDCVVLDPPSFASKRGIPQNGRNLNGKMIRDLDVFGASDFETNYAALFVRWVCGLCCQSLRPNALWQRDAHAKDLILHISAGNLSDLHVLNDTTYCVYSTQADASCIHIASFFLFNGFCALNWLHLLHILILIYFVTVGYTPVVYGISPYTWVIYIWPIIQLWPKPDGLGQEHLTVDLSGTHGRDPSGTFWWPAKRWLWMTMTLLTIESSMVTTGLAAF
jgi:hypothetical protein